MTKNMKFTAFPKLKTKRAVYLDHAAATPMAPEVFAVMKPFLMEEYGNPGGLYKVARVAKEAVDHARETVARIFGAQPRNIIFTGSGTESDNLAIFGVARQYIPPLQGGIKGGNPNRGKHLITISIEHHAVLHSVEALAKEGCEITQLPVDEYGLVTAEQVRAAIRDDTILVTIMYANNEIGTIEPIADIGRAIMHWKQEHGRKPTDPPFFHTDACQAAGYCELNVEKLHVDLMTTNGSKIYGPKGTGVLYKRDTVRVKPLIYGGGQEMRFRGGTENVAGIVGLAKALEMTEAMKEKEAKRVARLRDYLWHRIQQAIPKVVLNGHPTERLPNNLNVSILDIEGEALLLYMDEYGVALSTGSACTSESLDPSHVIVGIGKPYEYAHGSIRFSLGRGTRKKDIDYVMKVLPAVVERLREISPVKLQLDEKGRPKEDAKKPVLAAAFAGDGMPHWMTSSRHPEGAKRPKDLMR